MNDSSPPHYPIALPASGASGIPTSHPRLGKSKAARSPFRKWVRMGAAVSASVLLFTGCGKKEEQAAPPEQKAPEKATIPAGGETPKPAPPQEKAPAPSAPAPSAPAPSAPQAPAVSATPAPAAPLEPVPPAPGWKKYVNTKEALPDGLKDKFVGFTFNYPEKFVVVPGDANFIKVEESISAPGGNFTLENFAVGNLVASPEAIPGMDQDMIFPMLIEQFGAKFAQGFPNYKKVAEAPEEVAGLKGRALLFQAEFKGTDKGDIAFYGKVLLARQKGKERGVALLMLATSLDPDVKSAADVGVKGDLGAIVKTFRLTGD